MERCIGVRARCACPLQLQEQVDNRCKPKLDSIWLGLKFSCGLASSSVAAMALVDDVEAQLRRFEWVALLPDVLEELREFRLRAVEGRSLTSGVILPQFGRQEVVLGTLDCCKLNAALLKPLLKIMADHGCIFTPPLYLLQGVGMSVSLSSLPSPAWLLPVLLSSSLTERSSSRARTSPTTCFGDL